MKKYTGFTLLEILIALVIFAVLGVLTALSLHRTIKNKQALNRQDKRIVQLQLAMTLIRRDLLQAIDRPIINKGNQNVRAFQGSNTTVSFTRTGLLNPFNHSRRTDMQRVRYHLSGRTLQRLTWTVLDQAPSSKPATQTILTGIKSLAWTFVSHKNQLSANWPQLEQQDMIPLPKAVLLKMQLEGEGEVDGVFPVPAIGVVNETNSVS